MLLLIMLQKKVIQFLPDNFQHCASKSSKLLYDESQRS